ncbi:MAG: hypothetical protein AVDCRST_MAG89-4003 [uncultured Gemmatimonadetes bacterium]|uniref:Uncharacterized protein n=1 Tax=uncultured Gemmatimonadota bacterium TaxID=203437 RepID=A0A6J4MNX0_9BACT|nr:MAG: hypothetical protein AVDCRST_MAG89-4003 [uncultured Gemmatimonadota bacterium]
MDAAAIVPNDTRRIRRSASRVRAVSGYHCGGRELKCVSAGGTTPLCHSEGAGTVLSFCSILL